MMDQEVYQLIAARYSVLSTNDNLNKTHKDPNEMYEIFPAIDVKPSASEKSRTEHRIALHLNAIDIRLERALYFLIMMISISPLTALAQPARSYSSEAIVGPAAQEAKGLDLTARDLSVRPGDDFIGYAEGLYLKRLVIPPNRSIVGRYYSANDENDSRIKDVIADAVKNPNVSAAARNVASLYHAYIDEKLVDRLGASPLEKDLARVRSVTSKTQMCRLMGATQGGFGASMIRVGVHPDPDQPEQYAVYLGPTGLGLPGRDYYLQPNLLAVKQRYMAYVEQILNLDGWKNAKEASVAIVEFETAIAEAEHDDRERRDASISRRTETRKDVLESTPGFCSSEFLDAAKVGKQKRYVIDQFSTFPKIAKAFNTTSLNTLKAWATFHITDEAARFLPERYVNARFAFRGQALSGLQQIPSRQERALRAVNDTLTDEVGQLYVAKYFDPEAKSAVQKIADTMVDTLRIEITNSTWLSPTTKAEAIRKLNHTWVAMGYKDKWRVYSFAITPKDLYGDIEREDIWSYNLQIAKLGHPVDHGEWELPAQDINAENNTSIGLLTFPAALLRPPNFDKTADAAVNYGAIGATIGHELTHSFDDQGRQIDSTGRHRNWWSSSDAEHFDRLAARISEQYSQFEPLPGVHVKGPLIVGEALADTQGITLALDAYHRSLAGKPAPIIDGLTGDQRFFLSCAQWGAAKSTDAALRESIANDPHPPLQIRVNGEVRNVDEWYTAFDVLPGDKLYLAPEKRVHLW